MRFFPGVDLFDKMERTSNCWSFTVRKSKRAWKIVSRFYLDTPDKCRLSLNQSFKQNVDFFLEINGEIFNDLQQNKWQRLTNGQTKLPEIPERRCEEVHPWSLRCKKINEKLHQWLSYDFFHKFVTPHTSDSRSEYKLSAKRFLGSFGWTI